MAYQTKPRWTQRQTDFLIANFDRLKDEDIATVLGKTLKSIRRKRDNLGLTKVCGRGIVAASEKAHNYEMNSYRESLKIKFSTNGEDDEIVGD